MAGVTAARADELAALEFFAGRSTRSLEPLAAQLRPLTAAPGEILMRQGDPAVSFLLLGAGRVQITHTGTEGPHAVVDVNHGMIVGEIALMRGTPRTATVVALDEVTGWVGGHEAFATMLEVPGMMDKLVRIARQRLAAFIAPIPLEVRDGSWFYLRPVLPGDNERTINGPVEFSSETLYRRFQSARKPTPRLMAYLFEVDYADHFVWVFTEGAEGPVVADARFVRDENDPTTAEIAFVVGDEYQGRGIGTVLMDALIVAASYDGVRRFTARVLTDNYAMRRIMDRYGATWHREDLGVVVTEIDVPDPATLPFPPETTTRIRDVTRQVIRAVG
ncbi:GNAT family N-acetyltransferase [Mycobacterium sp. GA-2829]|uniref:GNAT family N-acetyltransferase n=1 Tax=Mycobacterium sp. GA-2829 TaxID=1772283 RepID=UPI0007402C9E|nr:GNAT family N-acetyltransferase [Mycobacterium sp. GA-2829]KUI24404.1 acetyltransferase [Mycobacterium sp. GA-2829]